MQISQQQKSTSTQPTAPISPTSPRQSPRHNKITKKRGLRGFGGFWILRFSSQIRNPKLRSQQQQQKNCEP